MEIYMCVLHLLYISCSRFTQLFPILIRVSCPFPFSEIMVKLYIKKRKYFTLNNISTYWFKMESEII